MKKIATIAFSAFLVGAMIFPSTGSAAFSFETFRAQLDGLRAQLDLLIKQSETALRATQKSVDAPSSFSVPTTPSLQGTITLEELPNSPEVSCTLPELLPRAQSGSVSLLQISLYKSGYYKEGYITGYYGRLTEEAVKKYQTEHGLSPTGRLDRASAEKLTRTVGEYFEECRAGTEARPITEVPLPPTPHETSTQASLAVLYPRAGYVLDNSGGKDSGLIANIQWTSSSLDNRTLTISLNGEKGLFKVIASGIPNSGNYAWKYDASIPNALFSIGISVDGGGIDSAYSGYFTLTGNSSFATSTPPVATSTPPAATSTRAHGSAPWNYGWDDFTSPVGADHGAQILENYREHPEEYGANPIGNNGYVPNPALYGSSNPSMPSAVLRLYKACGDHWINRKEYIPVEQGGYMNYRCTNRYQQQCFDDGSFDSYYDEACIYGGATTTVSADYESSYAAALVQTAERTVRRLGERLKKAIE